MEQSSFFNSVDGDRRYDMEEFALYFKQFLSSGIYHKDNVPALLVRAGTGLTTTMDSGSAYIEGYMYRNTTTITFAHDAASLTNPRIDRIVLRLDRGVNARSIKAVVKKGIASTNPIPIALERNNVVYEISLAQVRINAGATSISSITDERLNPTVAGLVSSLISVPTERFLEDWNKFMAEITTVKNEHNASLTKWKKDLEDDRAKYYRDWDDWFRGVQNEIGSRLLGGRLAPPDAVAGDIWFKEIRLIIN